MPCRAVRRSRGETASAHLPADQADALGRAVAAQAHLILASPRVLAPPEGNKSLQAGALESEAAKHPACDFEALSVTGFQPGKARQPTAPLITQTVTTLQLTGPIRRSVPR